MSDELAAHEQTAYQFLESAFCLDKARQCPSDSEFLEGALDSNVFLWFWLKRHIINSEPNASDERVSHIIQLSDFMARAAVSIRHKYDDRVMEHLVTMNLNMCERILLESALA